MLNTMQFPTTFGQNTNNNPYMDNRMPSPEAPMPFPQLATPQPMSGDMTENNLYPYESSNNNLPNQSVPTNFAKGGRVKKKQAHNPYPSLAEMIRQQGNGEDSILAHINPLEAMMLKQMGGSGTINKKTGLPQFGIFNKPGKAFKSVLGGGGGAILGNMLLPGLGGIIGGALGQGLQNKSRGKAFTSGLIKGGLMGASLPSLSNLLGSGANSLGMSNVGNYLTNYGNTNAILPSLGMGESASSGAMPTHTLGASNMASYPGTATQVAGGARNALAQQMAPTAVKSAPASDSFIDMLTHNGKNFLTKPKNLLALAPLVSSFANKPKEKSPEKVAQEHKRYAKAMMLTPAERASQEANNLAERQMERRIARNQYLPEELFESRPVYRKTSTPEEYKKNGRWLTYYNNPEFSGSPLPMKHGGRVPSMVIEEKEIVSPFAKGTFFKGRTKGQNDEIEALVSDGEYVIPADVVSHLGDGNSMAGGKECDNFVKNVRKSKGMPNRLPPKAKSILNYMR